MKMYSCALSLDIIFSLWLTSKIRSQSVKMSRQKVLIQSNTNCSHSAEEECCHNVLNVDNEPYSPGFTLE